MAESIAHHERIRTALLLFAATANSILACFNWYMFLRDRSYSPEIHALAHTKPLGVFTPIVGTVLSVALWWLAYRHARRHEDDPL